MSQFINQPVLDITFIGKLDTFVLRIFPNLEDMDSMKRIVKRYADDGYTPDLQHIRAGYINAEGVRVNRQPVERSLSELLGFKHVSAFRRA